MASSRVLRVFRRRGAPWAFVDISLCLLFVYMTQTEWIRRQYNDAPNEQMLPALDLSEVSPASGDRGYFDDEGVLLVSLEARDSSYIWKWLEQEGPLNTLVGFLKDHAPRELCLRVATNVPHGQVMQTIAIAREAGVGSISFGFNPEEGSS